ncbi:MAG: hypothetical protein CMC78_01685 [Flavobacteriaceae bacterium]|nr:hypothetical protein [Flavobacteriaceae bacterium]
MKRRSFIASTTNTISGLGFSISPWSSPAKKETEQPIKVCATVDQEKVSFYTDIINDPVKIFHIADTHLFMNDHRGRPFQKYSNRMAMAYN